MNDDRGKLRMRKYCPRCRSQAWGQFAWNGDSGTFTCDDKHRTEYCWCERSGWIAARRAAAKEACAQ